MGDVKEIYELKGAERGIRGISRELDISRNTVRRYLKSPEAMRPKPRPRRGSKLDPYTGHIDRRMAEGLDNCRVLDREVRALGYEGSYSTVVQYVRPRRRRLQPEATMRFETAPGEQAQVDWGSLSYLRVDGKRRRLWVFVMTLGWSRACYVELVRRADTASFIQGHVNAFDYLGGVPRRCLYDNAKVVTLGRDEEGRTEWNRRMLDFALSPNPPKDGITAGEGGMRNLGRRLAELDFGRWSRSGPPSSFGGAGGGLHRRAGRDGGNGTQRGTLADRDWREFAGTFSWPDVGSLGFPRPAPGKMQSQPACRAGEPSGQGEEPSPEGLGGHGLLTQADARGPAGQVMRHYLGGQPGGVGGEAARGEMVQPHAVLEVSDGVLDLGVAAMIGLQLGQLPIPVGDEAVIAVGGEEGQLGAGRGLHPPDDEPYRRGIGLAPEGSVSGLGHVGGAFYPVGNRRPGIFGYRLDTYCAGVW